MSLRAVAQIGLERLATILDYNQEDHTILIGLNEASFAGTPKKISVPIPVQWAGSKGEFAGGYPPKGSTVVAAQGSSGQWFISNYSVSNAAVSTNQLNNFIPGRYVIQVANNQRIFLDPNSGINVGNELNYAQFDPRLNIFTCNYSSQMYFSEASRKIDGIIKRDIYESAKRSIGESNLLSHQYNKSLNSIPIDPSSSAAILSNGFSIRNAPFTEQRELIYEFANSYDVLNDGIESSLYKDPTTPVPKPRVNRRNNRADALSLSQEYPNHLIEIIKGTAVDAFGNVLDINKNILPVGKIDELSIKKNSDPQDAFNRIKAQLRKSIAYNFEINTKKGTNDEDASIIPDVDSQKNYGRDRSRFSFSIDKEGQFKLNAPASSESGNIPLLVRSENFSNIMAKQDPSINPSDFIKEDSGKEIYLDSFTSKGSITISGKDGYVSPIDRFTEQPIQLGTAYHTITDVCKQFQSSAGYVTVGVPLVRWDQTNALNKVLVPFKHMVTNEIILSGENANGGGRSGCINLDGFLSMNIGANTVDRQSMWLDTAGGIVACIGRDKQGISIATTLDGDLLMQVGGPGIGTQYDERFEDQNDAYRDGTVEIRVIMNGQLAIFRIGPRPDGSGGIDIASPGTITLSCEKDMILKSKSSIKLEGENIVMYAETTKRIVRRHPINTTI
jgi:hypothetical protein